MVDPKHGVVDEDKKVSSGEIVFVGEDDGLRGFAKRHSWGVEEEGSDSP